MTLRLSYCVCESHMSEEQSALSSAPPPPGRWWEVWWGGGGRRAFHSLTGCLGGLPGRLGEKGNDAVPRRSLQKLHRGKCAGQLRGLSGSRPWSYRLAARGSGIPPDFAAWEQHLWDTFCGFRCLVYRHLLSKGRGLFTPAPLHLPTFLDSSLLLPCLPTQLLSWSSAPMPAPHPTNGALDLPCFLLAPPPLSLP